MSLPHLMQQSMEPVGWSGGRAAAPRFSASRRGFGSRLIEQGLAAEVDGDLLICFEPAGVVCVIEATT
jgi:hypothetical protein